MDKSFVILFYPIRFVYLPNNCNTGLNDIKGMDPEEKNHMLFTIDAMIQTNEQKNIAALYL